MKYEKGKAMKDNVMLGFVLSGITGLLLLVYTVNKVQEQVDFLKSGQSTVAKVFKLETVEGDDGVVQYKPIFVYRTPSGEPFIYTDYFASRPASWQIGDAAHIVYNPLEPQQAKILTVFEVFGSSAPLLVLAVALMVVGGGYVWAERFLTSLL
ncbi:DUF3592 domain-containing protein [Hymenobacter lutimineralis]|uniref:DUF3592 domain-containing protein n=1 Tax=Hymenobacter lutimineralis TaxID=2606448 RepID=A0A5D6UUH1_9BACT|nr:DUF3592 domain-containing protein [Hymenobacter lutimineralis]TYZ06737.1 DUF3592 domain-containing protein [Hymenobacter lutimineralis]